MGKPSKRYLRSKEKIKGEGPFAVDEAVDFLKKFDGAKFDETVEIAVKLGIDVKQANQSVRGAFSLPNGIGKSIRVIAFADGALAGEAKAAGAIEAGGEELVKKILDGWLDFDVAVAHPGMMRHVGKLGRVLGPHGKMPSPKSGTVTDNISQVVKEFSAGKIEFRNDDGGNVHAVMGKKSFAKEKLVQNVNAFLDHIHSLKPPASKGVYMQKATLSTTMGPGVPLKVV
jgi:large subunit ribosomal protein L1